MENNPPEPLRITYYVPGIRLAQGGVVRAVLDWCNIFAQRGHQITLMTYQPDDVPSDWSTPSQNKPRVVVLPAPRNPLNLLSSAALRTADTILAYTDVFHLQAPWLNGNRQLAKISVEHAVPYIVSTHGMLADWAMNQRGFKKRIYMSLFGRRFLDAASCIHCTAALELQQANKWFDNPQTTILPYLFDLKPFESLPGPDLALSLLSPQHRQLPKLLFLSRLHEKKGVDILIRAAAILRDRKLPFVLLIAGTGHADHEKYLRDLATQLNLSQHIVFLGLITGVQKISLYQAADLFVLPTLQENFGLVLIESLAAATPVLTTKGTDIWPEIQKAGAIIADTTPQALANTIAPLLQDLPALKSLGQRGRQWVFDTLAVEPLAQKYESLYRSLITA